MFVGIARLSQAAADVRLAFDGEVQRVEGLTGGVPA